MMRALVVLAALLGAVACESRAEEYRTAVDTLTRGQKDSLVAEMPIPGAGAVGRALQAAERASSRTETFDTLR